MAHKYVILTMVVMVLYLFIESKVKSAHECYEVKVVIKPVQVKFLYLLSKFRQK